jgi:YD repeat-containing protein
MADLKLIQMEWDKFDRRDPSNPAIRTISKETTPTDSTQNNGSLVLTYDGDGNLITIAKTISGTTYTKTLSYTGSDLTGISAWT